MFSTSSLGDLVFQASHSFLALHFITRLLLANPALPPSARHLRLPPFILSLLPALLAVAFHPLAALALLFGTLTAWRRPTDLRTRLPFLSFLSLTTTLALPSLPLAAATLILPATLTILHALHTHITTALRQATYLPIATEPPALIPPTPEDHAIPPVPPLFTSASFFSILTFHWAQPLVSTGRLRTLELPDIPPLARRMRSAFLSVAFRPHLAASLRQPSPSLWSALCNTLGPRFFLGGILKVGNDCCVFVLPLLLRAIILHLQSPSMSSTARGIGLAVAIFFTTLTKSLFYNAHCGVMVALRARVEAIVTDTIYAKTTRLSVATIAAFSHGFVNNLMAVDTQTIGIFLVFSHDLWSAPTQITISLCLLYNLLGPAATLAAFFVIAVALPVQANIIGAVRMTRKRASSRSDDRVKLVSEALHGIEVIKFQSWTMPFLSAILDVRVQELALVRTALYLQACFSGLVTSVIVILPLATLSTYVLTGGTLDASVIFPALAIFHLLRPQLFLLPDIAVDLARAMSSTDRVLSFLQAADLPALAPHPTAVPQPPAFAASNAVVIAEGASTAWDALNPTLRDINLILPPGSLTCVLGAVASGKSTLLASLLGEVPLTSGVLGLRPGATVSYCAQTAFIRNASLRENILFGAPYDAPRYRRALTLACMLPDLNALPSGDRTEIGGRGVNLSGGQKARCALARALYSQADVVLLDDPLAAVDAHVGRQIWEKCIVDEMKGCSRVMATNSLHFGASAEVDFVVILEQGRMVEFGRREVLAKDANSAFAKMLAAEAAAVGVGDDEECARENESEAGPEREVDGEVFGNADSSEAVAADGIFAGDDDEKDTEGRLVQSERKSRGGVAKAMYSKYIRASGGVAGGLFVVALFLASTLAQVGASVYLTEWSESSRLEGYKTSGHGNKLFVYAIISVIASLLPIAANFAMVSASIRASVVLHERLCVGVFGSPMSWFHTTPAGRIINRFNSTIDKVDNTLAITIQSFLRLFFNSSCAFAVVIYNMPSFIFFIAPAAAVFSVVQSYYRTTAIDLRRLQSMARSPLYSHFDETLDGIMTIRAFEGGSSRASRENQELADVSVGTSYAYQFAVRWLTCRTEFITACLTFVAASLAVLVDRISPELAGLSLLYSFQTVTWLGYVVRQATEAESQMSSIEQLSDYSDTPPHPQEERLEVAVSVLDEAKRDWKGLASNRFVRSLQRSDRQRQGASSTWPSRGELKFSDVSMRYRPELDLALRGVSFDIQPGWHVGCVGRTGAGKSSLVGGIMRMQELASGVISVDGQDISKLPLETLRSSLSVVPQAPVLFSGTVRSNLDMAGVFTDAECRNALDLSGLQSTVADGVLTLDTEVSEGGCSMSQGQRQLLCLGRVLLRNSKICVFDEASSSVDQGTDRAMLSTIRREFRGKTLFIIAHRLQTVVSCDRVIVMEAGKVVEFGSPADLVAEPNSQFGSFIDQTGPETAARLRALASAEKKKKHALLAGLDEVPNSARGDPLVPPASCSGT